MQYGIFIRVEHSVYVVKDEENSSQRIYHVERSLQQSSKKDWDFPSGMLCPSIFPEERGYETWDKNGKIGGTFHVEYTSHPFRWLHTSYNVNFGESFLTISNLYTTFLVQHKVLLLYIAADIWCTSYDETKFSKVHQKNVQKLDQLIFILYRGLPIHIRPDDYVPIFC